MFITDSSDLYTLYPAWDSISVFNRFKPFSYITKPRRVDTHGTSLECKEYNMYRWCGGHSDSSGSAPRDESAERWKYSSDDHAAKSWGYKRGTTATSSGCADWNFSCRVLQPFTASEDSRCWCDHLASDNPPKCKILLALSCCIAILVSILHISIISETSGTHVVLTTLLHTGCYPRQELLWPDVQIRL